MKQDRVPRCLRRRDGVRGALILVRGGIRRALLLMKEETAIDPGDECEVKLTIDSGGVRDAERLLDPMGRNLFGNLNEAPRAGEEHLGRQAALPRRRQEERLQVAVDRAPVCLAPERANLLRRARELNGWRLRAHITGLCHPFTLHWPAGCRSTGWLLPRRARPLLRRFGPTG